MKRTRARAALGALAVPLLAAVVPGAVLRCRRTVQAVRILRAVDTGSVVNAGPAPAPTTPDAGTPDAETTTRAR
ncbi:hypothetical protein [Streptomyces gilvus]|uniref:hypothetical protein n=1 Tax=Streptomyces gilvus TaxID=2920937 RepID=UPI001F102040|nr:hypothetical protein [Streptomyces sp. CME 23]MCH5677563.1 hypothetical protein [Streptomyces sp. CME 23]